MSFTAHDLINIIRLVASQQRDEVNLDGVVYPGSYDPKANTVTVTIGDTAGISAEVDPDDQFPVTVQNVPLGSHAYQGGYGPLGGERVHLVAAQGGSFRANFDHDEDDSPNIPPGETWQQHFARGLQSIMAGESPDAFWKLTQDGETAGDGMGGLRLGATAFASIVTALLMLGAEGLDKTKRAAITKEDLDAAFESYTNDVIAPWAADFLQPGAGAPAPTGTPTTSGSSIVKIAP